MKRKLFAGLAMLPVLMGMGVQAHAQDVPVSDVSMEPGALLVLTRDSKMFGTDSLKDYFCSLSELDKDIVTENTAAIKVNGDTKYFLHRLHIALDVNDPMKSSFDHTVATVFKRFNAPAGTTDIHDVNHIQYVSNISHVGSLTQATNASVDDAMNVSVRYLDGKYDVTADASATDFTDRTDGTDVYKVPKTQSYHSSESLKIPTGYIGVVKFRDNHGQDGMLWIIPAK